MIWVTGAGSADDQDRGSADSSALDQATTQVNAECAGEIVDVAKTSDGCFSTGSGSDDNPTVYHCMVSVKAKCVVQGR